MAAEILREPAFPASEFELLKQSRLAAAENQRSEPQALAVNAMARHYAAQYPPDDARYVPTIEESIERIKASKLEQATEFYRGFYGASSAEFAAVGDFDAPEVQKLLQELFGAWKSPREYKRIARPHRNLDAVTRSIETPDKANAVLFVAMPLAMGDEHKDYPPLLLANYLLGGTSVSRLYLRIRGKEGLSYGVGSQVQASPQDENGQFVAFAISNPQNTQKVEAAFKDELEKALANGFTAEEVAAGKKSWLQSQTVNRSQDAGLVRQLRQGAHVGRTMAFTAETERKIAALTPEDLAAALRKHVVPARLSYFKAGDFKKAGGGD
jgi:zinc protease